MKVALIDTGILNIELTNKSEIRHFSFNGKSLVEEYKKPSDSHGTDCYKEILSSCADSEIQIYDFNVTDEAGSLQVSNIVKSIKKSIEQKVDIINISMGLSAYSKELYEICYEAMQNNIVVLSAASHNNTVSFPADFNNVICVKVDQGQTEKIKAIDNTIVSVAMKDFIVKENDVEFDFSSSSLACARLCGYLCCDLSDIPLNDKFKTLSLKYKLNFSRPNDSSSGNSLSESGIQHILSNNRVAVVLFPLNLHETINENLLHENIVAYYNHENCGFYSFKSRTLTTEFDVIMLLNSAYFDLEVPNSIEENYKSYKVIRIGNYLGEDDNKYLYDYDRHESSEMAILEKPVIAIASLCSGLNKSDIQLSLLNSFKNDGLDIEAVSNNPIGVLYNMNVFNFPGAIKFPNIVYNINRYMYSSEINKNIDAWLINIGGAIGQVNNMNIYNFGKLSDAYFLAANIDLAIMCITPSSDIQNLKLQLADFYKHGTEKIFLVLSQNDIDYSSMNYRNGLHTYCVDSKKYSDFFKHLRANIEEKVFTLEDVQNGVLYDNVLEALS